MNHFEEMHERRSKRYKKQKFKELLAFELNQFYEIHQGYEDIDVESLVDIFSILDTILEKPKFDKIEVEEILEDGISLAEIKYGIRLESKVPLVLSDK